MSGRDGSNTGPLDDLADVITGEAAGRDRENTLGRIRGTDGSDASDDSDAPGSPLEPAGDLGVSEYAERSRDEAGAEPGES